MNCEIISLSKKFGEKIIFDHFSYSFEATGAYLIKGASGVGKTTLLRIIAGLDNDFTGSVFKAERLSFCFQEYRLFPWLSAIENVMIALHEIPSSDARTSARNILLQLGFSEDDLTLKPEELSGGMCQRVALARAFLAKSDLLILDEPTKELDHTLVENVCKIINELARDRLVIITSHDNIEDLIKLTDIILL